MLFLIFCTKYNLYNTNTFQNVSPFIPVHVPCGSEADYQVATRWNKFTNYTECVSLNDVEEIANIIIYPNPAKNKITIDCS